MLTAGYIVAQDKPAEKKDSAAAPAYIGIKKCSICHKGEAKGNVHEKWLATEHANAYKVLVDKKDGSEKKAECLECHTTGFNKGGYVLDAANAAEFEGIQCEACHGPGSDFRPLHNKDIEAAKKVGFIPKPTEEKCVECHNKKSPTFKGFKYEEFHKKIDHRYRQAEKKG